jgi:hypothetical protein
MLEVCAAQAREVRAHTGTHLDEKWPGLVLCRRRGFGQALLLHFFGGRVARPCHDS